LPELAVPGKTSTVPVCRFSSFGSVVTDLVDPALVPLGGAIPSPDLLPGVKLARIVGNLAREQLLAVSHDPVPFADASARFSRRSLDWGCHSSATTNSCVVNGASGSLYLALRA
jgi:hypothetical protein